MLFSRTVHDWIVFVYLACLIQYYFSDNFLCEIEDNEFVTWMQKKKKKKTRICILFIVQEGLFCAQKFFYMLLFLISYLKCSYFEFRNSL